MQQRIVLTVGLPGSGLSYTHLEKPGQWPPAVSAEPVQTYAQPRGSAVRGWLWIGLAAVVVLAAVARLFG